MPSAAARSSAVAFLSTITRFCGLSCARRRTSLRPPFDGVGPAISVTRAPPSGTDCCAPAVDVRHASARKVRMHLESVHMCYSLGSSVKLFRRFRTTLLRQEPEARTEGADDPFGRQVVRAGENVPDPELAPDRVAELEVKVVAATRWCRRAVLVLGRENTTRAPEQAV